MNNGGKLVSEQKTRRGTENENKSYEERENKGEVTNAGKLKHTKAESVNNEEKRVKGSETRGKELKMEGYKNGCRTKRELLMPGEGKTY